LREILQENHGKIATNLQLVGGFNPSEKYESQWEGFNPIYEMEKKCLKPPTRQNWQF
jgi:hypothetical protein